MLFTRHIRLSDLSPPAMGEDVTVREGDKSEKRERFRKEKVEGIVEDKKERGDGRADGR